MVYQKRYDGVNHADQLKPDGLGASTDVHASTTFNAA